ncbi:D-alanine--D-alanine ligase family protein [Kutzneria sp. CA-103260]|uniref:D-alanine--D-alanine ligase family protein n=1 Tax=Kutzneria sp. CA-103260 TaxID=2802641 RepID=UPI001BAAE729|nr:hypothetical protein [Kutzneria sp. CA-103260]
MTDFVRQLPGSLPSDVQTLRGLRIAVVYGAVSEEDAVYIHSAPRAEWSLTAIMRVLQDHGLDAEHLDPTAPDFAERVRGFDAAFVNVHGPYGEDGRLQGLLEYLNVPYTGSGVLAGSVGMDKLVCKAIFRHLGLATPRDSGLLAGQIPAGFPLPGMLKAVDGGSSVGTRLVDNSAQIAEAIREFTGRGFRRYFLEEFIAGRALTVAVIGGPAGSVALAPLEFVTEAAFYDEASKLGGASAPSVQYQFPEDLPPSVVKAMSVGAEAAYDFLDCRGAIRVDYIVDDAETVYALEINTIPGLQPHSNLPAACARAGIPYDALVLRLLAQAVRAHRPVPWAAPGRPRPESA